MAFDIQRFESSAHQNGVLYWLAHEFMLELGYETWPSFLGVIRKAIASCLRLGLDHSDAFIPDTRQVDGREVQTYRLTRFACLLVTMHADSKKPQVAAAKTALAAVADRLIAAQLEQDGLGRIEARDDLKAAESVMAGAAQRAGVSGEEMGIFKNSGFLGMYNMSLRDLRQAKGLSDKDIAYDFMGLTELAGNLFRVTQTAESLKQTPDVGLRLASQTARSVGFEVRQMMIRNSGVAPENLPVEKNLNDVKKQLRSTAREMKKLDSGKTAGKKKTSS
ncbi:damage-inducible protein D [Bordetella avium]|uniref:damage-inducible protein D n=1 Tax=Bordetella avium TaxID=521 RepID=UPI000E68A0C9|nr:damage-inducible protein D [Bordetella avium]RIQ51072.1 damage-inducible protein D [Bordetella avium]